MSTPSPIWLVHGWAANHHIFDPLAARLAGYPLRAPDLPGHGQAAFHGRFDLTALADSWAACLSEPIHLLGWSLGGAVALTLAARHPDKVRSLCLTAAFAKLQAVEGYPEGLPHIALYKMLPLLEQDYPKYMRQFLQLQFLYAQQHAGLLAEVLPKLLHSGTPPALSAALNAAVAFDGRPLLAGIRCPSLLLFGDKDNITPQRMGTYLHHHLPDSRLQIISGAAHAPFLSHADRFADSYCSWLDTL